MRRVGVAGGGEEDDCYGAAGEECVEGVLDGRWTGVQDVVAR